MVRPWLSLPSKAVFAPSLKVLRARLDGGIEQPGLVKGVQIHGGRLDLDGPEG